MFRSLLAAGLLTWGISAFAAPPSQAIAAARTSIAAQQFDAAVAALRAAIPEALALPSEQERRDALAAIHFYAALAEYGRGSENAAREELRQFAHFHPGSSRLDPQKYPPGFVKMMEDVTRPAVAPTSFAAFYPGFDSAAPPSTPGPSLALWGSTPDLQVLGTDEEKQEWGILRDDDGRRAFIEAFWARRRGFREEFQRRAAFADHAFGSDLLSGALTDRGKVFVLLGPPARVYRRNIGRRQGMYIDVNGTEERWVYFKGQLPATMPQTEVDYRFITQPAYGEGVMEKDYFPLRALAEMQKQLAK